MVSFEIVGRDGRKRRVEKDDDAVLQPGETMRFDVQFMDAMPPDVQRILHDAFEHERSVKMNLDEQTRAVNAEYDRVTGDAYAEMRRELQDAWRQPAPASQPASEPAKPISHADAVADALREDREWRENAWREGR